MPSNFLFTLASILILPLIPALIIYKFLPDKNGENNDEVGGETGGIGPFKGLSWKLKGAFAGYFLLVCVGGFLHYFQHNNDLQKQINNLSTTLKLSTDSLNTYKNLATKNPVIDWHIKGIVKPGEKEGTRFFYDDGTTSKSPDGSFQLIKRAIASQGKAAPPNWVCIYNPATGFQVVSLNRELNHPDIKTFEVSFDDEKHTILIKKPIDINSKSKDSLVAVANFIEAKPERRAMLMDDEKVILNEAKIIKADKKINAIKLENFEKTRKSLIIKPSAIRNLQPIKN